MTLKTIIKLIENELLPNINLKSIKPNDPIIVSNVPNQWKVLGSGNYAAVLYNSNFPYYAVKIYAENRPGIDKEIEVYNKLGYHPSYSQCFYHDKNYLILRRLDGITLYDAIVKGIQIPESVISDIDKALDYAITRNLYPHDVHFKNVMMKDGKGFVVDVSDFYKYEKCLLWAHSKKAYNKIYKNILYKLHPPIPNFILNIIRKIYQLYKR
ncbi:serine/threonine protein kinase [Clostridium manihotivorum]|uniref:Serine/threonine protein kinase n=1 Tax=Clostridium manihotivorum TaxID=2320868 RepID=A0A3R5U997_9CLOT|nr:serine/threonine protein kinase [Clostridium manihotivorum]QAA32620.1 serine/threonine protein kinase [Clostridium manihotivorum]